VSMPNSIPPNQKRLALTHACSYYPLEISYFKSTLDSKLLSLLWSKYWVNTLSSNPWLAVRSLLVSAVNLFVLPTRIESSSPTKSWT